MQYQVFKTDTGELVAWFDTETQDAILKRGYEIKKGENLHVQEVLEKGFSPRTVAKFEKVTWGQYCSSKKWDPASVFTEASRTKEYDDLKLPRRATKGSAGYDFFAPFDFSLEPGETIKIPTGIKAKISEGFVLKEYPRSSLGFNYRVRLDNTVGIIDSDYYNNEKNEGHIFIKITNEGNKTLEVKKGDAFCQGIFSEYFLAEEEEVTEERIGGIGSTSK